MKYLLLLLFAMNASAAIRTENGKILPVTLVEYPLKTLIREYAELMDVNITYSSKLFRDPKVHLVLNSPLTKEEFSQVFYNILSNQGFTPIEEKGILWIHNSRDIRYLPAPISTDMNFPTDSRFRTLVYKLKYPVSNFVARNLRPYMSRYGRVIDFSDARTMIINDTSDNLKRLVKTIAFMDTEEAFKNFVNDVPKKDPEEAHPLKEKVVELELEKKILEKKIINQVDDSYGPMVPNAGVRQ